LDSDYKDPRHLSGNPFPDLDEIHAENRRLRRAVDELSFLNDLALEISSSLNPEKIMDTVIKRSLTAVRAEQGVITLVDESSSSQETLVRAVFSSRAHTPIHLDQNLLGWMQINKKPLAINNPRDDERFRGVRFDDTIRSILCVPMMIRSTLIGVLTLYNKKKTGEFTSDDMRLLAIIASQSAQILENARLCEEEKELLRMQEDLRLAAMIQEELLPKTSPKISGYDIAGISLPAQLVGGDYFDFILLGDSCLAVCLGDVSGKGLPAALLMANLQATIRGQARPDLSCSECMISSNNLLHRSTTLEKFATCFLGILDLEKNLFCFSNAGHNPPLLFSESGHSSSLATGGIPLGIMPNHGYKEERIPFRLGDLMLIYSDGVTEALNTEEEEFGLERLEKLVMEKRELASSDLLQEIVSSVKEFSGEVPQMDDITVVIVKRDA